MLECTLPALGRSELLVNRANTKLSFLHSFNKESYLSGYVVPMDKRVVPLAVTNNEGSPAVSAVHFSPVSHSFLVLLAAGLLWMPKKKVRKGSGDRTVSLLKLQREETVNM